MPRKICTQNFAHFDVTGYKEDLKNASWYQVYNITNPNTAWNKFKQILVSIIDKHAPLVEKQVRRRNCPWLTHEIKGNMNDRDYYLRKARRTGREMDWSTYRRLRNQCNRLIRHSKANYMRNTFAENRNNSKSFWKQVKKIIR